MISELWRSAIRHSGGQSWVSYIMLRKRPRLPKYFASQLTALLCDGGLVGNPYQVVFVYRSTFELRFHSFAILNRFNFATIGHITVSVVPIYNHWLGILVWVYALPTCNLEKSIRAEKQEQTLNYRVFLARRLLLFTSLPNLTSFLIGCWSTSLCRSELKMH